MIKKVNLLVLILIVFLANACYTEIVRIIFKPDSKITVLFFAEKIKKLNKFSEHFKYRATPINLRSCPYKNMEDSELPDMKLQDKWRWNLKDKEIYIDNTIVTKKELIEEKGNLLDAELAKETPDIIQVIRLYKEIEQIKRP